jgi:cytochrome c oxidase subunit IV
MSTVDATPTLDTDAIVDHGAGHDAEHNAHDHDAHDHPSDLRYIAIAGILATITALEVAASYIDLGAFFLPALLGMMAVKFMMVVRLFMHLKFDNRVFSWLFFTGLILALAVYLAALATFRFFSA